MILATTTFEDYDRFMEIFSTKGAEKRGDHGCKGAQIFRDPKESDRVWVLFDWDEAGWQSFVSDPEVPPIMKEAGHTSRAQTAEFAGSLDRRAIACPSSAITIGGTPWKVIGISRPHQGGRHHGRRRVPLSFMGIANANVAKMVVDDINAAGGLLGRRVELLLEDSATTDSVGRGQGRQARRRRTTWT